ncbi:MAG: thiamine pyrophosphate-binding protein [Oscillospiraceae bacterium]|nr:thiamine pyrophosphate-binding protein [Oscillospiraceae bacterium]
MVRAADYIMEKLSEEGVKHLFMITGRGVLYLSDAAAKAEGIVPVPMHHEQACAFAASAYSSYNEKLGACLVSTGCAGTNALTSVLCAWQDGVPMVVVSGQNILRETSRHSGIPLRTWGQQEADIVSLAEHITKYAVMLDDPSRIVYEMEKALYLAQHGRKGPVWIDVPLDVQNMRIEPEEQEHFVPDEALPAATEEEIAYTVETLAASQRPVLLIGSGIRWANACDELRVFAEKNGIPVVYSASAPDTYGYDRELCIGSAGMMACSRSGCFALQNADLVLVLGNRLSPMTTGSEYAKFAREAKVIVVDVDKTEHSKNTVKIDRLIVSDVKAFLDKINNCDIAGGRSGWAAKCRHWKEAFPLCEDIHRVKDKVDLYRLAEALSASLPDDAVLLSDAGLEELIIPSNVVFSGERRCIHPTSQGAMGYALPAAIGAYYSSGKPVVAVIGDGSAMMNLQELATVDFNKLPIKILVISNNVYSVIRKRQKELFRTRTTGTDPENGVGTVDFAKAAECFGLKYVHIAEDSGLEQRLGEVFAENGAVLCEIDGVEDQDIISCSIARTSEKRFVQRPLEDQAPFLDRELFLSEMVIEPIDQ